jgi:DNA polymerase
MSETREALRHYVQFLHERLDLREVRLSRAAQRGLEVLAREAAATPGKSPPASVKPTSTRLDGPSVVAPGRRASVVAPPPTVVVAPLPPMEITGSTKAEQLAHLAGRANECVKCPHLAARRHHVVFGVGDPDAKIMFVGEGPGEEEDLQGEPFVGRAGQLLTKMIQAMGLSRETVYIANIVKCRPDLPPGVPGNRKPTRQEMDTCLPYLRAQIDVIRPQVLVALGATAVEGLLGTPGSIGALRGKFLEYRGIPVMPTYHPSYLLRNQSNTEKRKVWEDILKVMERTELPITDKQRGFFLAK